jgi:Phosphotransferase enzyme family
VTALSEIIEQLERRLGPLAGEPAPLEGGITNRNYRVRFGAVDYVLRLPGRETELLGISREAERLACKTAAELGIAPRLAYADDGYMLTRFLGARPADVPTALAPLARALRCFHDSGVELPVRFWVPDILERYASIVRARGGTLPPAYATAQEITARIAAALPLTDPVPCHNDLLSGNVLYVDLKVVLVDWEYAGMGHRLFDLGNLAVNNDLDDGAESRLLHAYCGGAPGRPRSAALKLMRLMSDAREAAWGVLQGVISELDFDFAAYAASHFERLERSATGGHLEEWLEHAAAA